MSSTPEGRIKTAIKRVLTSAGAYYHMPVQNGMGRPSLDFVGCHQGRFFAIEAKAGNKQPTKRQERTAEEMQQAGAATFVVNEVEGLSALSTWLQVNNGIPQSTRETQLPP